ncbi:unnamed protein product [Spirodela intermedia]|uniref:Uncharacterized protein n=1 Tax=Spirodela intermedia TaxID=51605 RepID=A0ABN7E9S7_SPIIN|nr:unnamed protein product [Spirodela intermedia]
MQPLYACKLAESSVDFLSILPLVQALLPGYELPALLFAPIWYSPRSFVHDGFSQWNHPLVLCALSQAKAACVMIDLCSGALAPWLPMVTAKVDLAIELIEDLLGVIQGGSESIVHFRSALKYIILALSGYVDDILAKYKVSLYTEVKHKVLFLVEMLEDFLEPVMSIVKGTIAFRDASTTFSAKQEERCGMALNIIRTAVQKPTVLPSLEREWRRGSVAPRITCASILMQCYSLYIGPNIPLPPEIDKCKPSSSKTIEREPLPTSNDYVHATSSKPINVDDSDGKIDLLEISMKVDMLDDANLLFAPPELKNTSLMKISNLSRVVSRASEFRQLALDLHSQVEITPESHDAAIDALLLAAECYVNPFFIMSLSRPKHLCNLYGIGSGKHKKNDGMELRSICPKSTHDLETIDRLERTRDKTVLEILLQAAKLDWEYNRKVSHNTEPRYDTEECCQYDNISLVDMQHADSITLVRQNQALLCQFVMRYLQKDQLNLHEILLQSLLFILQYATELFSLPEDVIDVILRSAEHLNGVLTSHRPLNGGTLQLSPAKLHAVQRHCLLLQKLVISLGVDDEMELCGYFQKWLSVQEFGSTNMLDTKIPIFSSCPFPLARFLGWMAVSHLAKKYLSDQLFLTFDLSHLTSLLSVFADDLALTEDLGVNKTWFQRCSRLELNKIFSLIKTLGPLILQMIIIYFKVTCTNVKAIIPCVLEAIISKHLEAMLPEMPRVTQTLISLCRSSFCDVSFLDVVFALLKPLISYALRKFEQDEPVLRDEHSSNDLESLCFEEIFSFIKCKIENNSVTGKRLTMDHGKKEILLSLLEWTDFTTLEPTTSFYDYLLAFQCVIDSCAMSLAQSLENIGIFIPIQKGKEEANTSSAVQLVDHKAIILVEVEEFSNVLESLVRKLCPAIEACWGSILNLRQSSLFQQRNASCSWMFDFIEDVLQCGSGDYTSKNWVASLEGLTEAILMNQRNHCWQVASCMLDYVFQLPLNFSDTSVIHICSVMKSFCSLAPRISWQDISNLGAHDHLIDVFCSMLGHWEPEQRYIALRHLGRLVAWISCNGLLSGFVPFTEQSRLQSFLAAVHTLPGLGRRGYTTHEVPFTRLSIACLQAHVYILLLMIVSEALCKLRTEFNDAKEVLKGVLSSSSSPKHSDPAFNTMRESILQVISSLASVQAYFDFFSQKIEKEAQELDEAEIELELLQKREPFRTYQKDVFRLQQIKEEIRSIEKSKLKEEIIVRRQRKLLVRRGRQKYLEEAAFEKWSFCKSLTACKDKELRYNLELERERQAQRELQKELELVESGVRSSRRDISSNPSSRPRERYRERDNGRTAPEGSSRGRDGGTFLATAAPGSTLVLAGSRSSFLDKQPPTILQPLERADERGRDSGDASSVGDPETASLEAGGFGSAPRQGRGGKSRQIVERREREGRREGSGSGSIPEGS